MTTAVTLNSMFAQSIDTILLWCAVIGNKISFAFCFILIYSCALCHFWSSENLIIPLCLIECVCVYSLCTEQVSICISQHCSLSCTNFSWFYCSHRAKCERREKPSGVYMLNMLFMLEFIRWKIIFGALLKIFFSDMNNNTKNEITTKVMKEKKTTSLLGGWNVNIYNILAKVLHFNS